MNIEPGVVAAIIAALEATAVEAAGQAPSASGRWRFAARRYSGERADIPKPASWKRSVRETFL